MNALRERMMCNNNNKTNNNNPCSTTTTILAHQKINANHASCATKKYSRMARDAALDVDALESLHVHR